MAKRGGSGMKQFRRRFHERHPDTSGLAAHMRSFGLLMIGHGVYYATYAEIGRPHAHAIGCVSAAHAAEILIKTRIAEEHPLLIFDDLPKPPKVPKPTKGKQPKITLGLRELVEKSRTVDYRDLPARLWATTGEQIPHEEEFLAFGQLRNQIIHLGVPSSPDIAEDTLRFSFSVMEPLIYRWWKITVTEAFLQYEVDASEENLIDQLKLIRQPFIPFRG